MIEFKEILIRRLLDEINRQCEFVLIAYTSLNCVLQDNTTQQAMQKEIAAFENREKISLNPYHSSLAIDQANEILSQASYNVREAQNQKVLTVSFYIQSLLVAAANISKIIWRISKKRKDETRDDFHEDLEMREKLRESLSIDREMEHYLFGKRDLRNDYEHFDERIVEHTRSSNGLVEGIGAFTSVANIGEENVLRFFDPSTFIISFKKDRIDLQVLIEEIKGLREKVNTVQQARLIAQLSAFNRNRKPNIS